MLIHIIRRGTKVLCKCNLMIQSSIVRDDRIRQTLQIHWLSAGNDVIQLFPDTEHRHRLKTLKVQIFLRHRRYWLRWLQNIKSKQSEVLYTLDTLKCQSCITLIQQNASLIVDWFCQTHTIFQVFRLHKYHGVTPPARFLRIYPRMLSTVLSTQYNTTFRLF